MSARDLRLVYVFDPNDKTGDGLTYYAEGYGWNIYEADVMRNAAVWSGQRYIMRRRSAHCVLAEP